MTSGSARSTGPGPAGGLRADAACLSPPRRPSSWLPWATGASRGPSPQVRPPRAAALCRRPQFPAAGAEDSYPSGGRLEDIRMTDGRIIMVSERSRWPQAGKRQPENADREAPSGKSRISPRDRHPPVNSPLPGRLMDAKAPRLRPIKT